MARLRVVADEEEQRGLKQLAEEFPGERAQSSRPHWVDGQSTRTGAPRLHQPGEAAAARRARTNLAITRLQWYPAPQAH